MIKNKQSSRSLVAFLVTWSFLVLTVTGIVLYIVPQGRVAYWVHWSLAGMEKEQWGWVHMMFGGVFIVTGILHLYYNWKPFKKYFSERVKGHFEIKREVVVSIALTLAIFAVSAMNVPPASWVIDLNTMIKNSWVTSPEFDPPFGHAEEVSLAGMARRMELDLEKALKELDSNNIKYQSKKDSLETVARMNATTPMAIYALMKRHEKNTLSGQLPTTVEEIEARFAGTGLGRKTVQEVCDMLGLDLQQSLDKLNKAGIAATGDASLKDVAESHGIGPIDLVARIIL